MGDRVKDLEEALQDTANQLKQTLIHEKDASYIQTPDYSINYQRRAASATLSYKDRLVAITFYDSEPDPRINYSYSPEDQTAVARLIATMDTAIASMLKGKIFGQPSSKTDSTPVMVGFFLGTKKSPESKPFNGIAKLIVEHAKAAQNHRK